MKKNPTLFLLVFLIASFFLSCRKDLDRKLIGTYKGTARYMIGNFQNPVRDRDTLYTDVVITVTEGTESTRKETRLTLTCMPTSIKPSYNENMPVNDGSINFMRTNRGSIGAYYKWNGTINSDSLKLTNKNEEGNGSIWQWEFKAQKQ